MVVVADRAVVSPARKSSLNIEGALRPRAVELEQVGADRAVGGGGGGGGATAELQLGGGGDGDLVDRDVGEGGGGADLDDVGSERHPLEVSARPVGVPPAWVAAHPRQRQRRCWAAVDRDLHRAGASSCWSNAHPRSGRAPLRTL